MFYMNGFDLLFGAGPAIRTIMELGFMPHDDDLLELTADQYESFFRTNGYTDEKIYVLLPKDQRFIPDDECNEIRVCTESDIETLKRAWQIVESYCKDSSSELLTDQSKIRYAASRLPAAFSEGTRFDKSKMLRIE